MSSSGKAFDAYRFGAMELVFQFSIAFLFMASACQVDAQKLQTVYFFTNGVGGSVLTPSGLTLGNDGNFYGTTENGGNQDDGTLFQLTTNGTLTMWPCFINLANSAYGSPNPNPLALGDDGNFYGTTSGGHGYGTVFRATTNGTLTVLDSFSGTNGVNPSALLLGTDGNFYGTTSAAA